MKLEIMVPDELVLSTEVEAVEAADATGRFGLRTGHEQFVTVLVPSLLVYSWQDRESYAAVDGGVLWLENDVISVITREAVLSDRLDELSSRAGAILSLRHRQESQSRTEFSELQAMLAKELARVRH